MKLLSKTQIMEAVVAGAVHESFTHSVDGVFDITAMREWAVRCKAPIVTILIDEVVAHIQDHRVIDQQRILDLDEDSWQRDPAMVVIFHEGNKVLHLLVDGSHRILRRKIEGLSDFQAYLIHSSEIIRPAPDWVSGVDKAIDWGDSVVDGKIVKRDPSIGQ